MISKSSDEIDDTNFERVSVMVVKKTVLYFRSHMVYNSWGKKKSF
jgi:hypothetical protein